MQHKILFHLRRNRGVIDAPAVGYWLGITWLQTQVKKQAALLPAHAHFHEKKNSFNKKKRAKILLLFFFFFFKKMHVVSMYHTVVRSPVGFDGQRFIHMHRFQTAPWFPPVYLFFENNNSQTKYSAGLNKQGRNGWSAAAAERQCNKFPHADTRFALLQLLQQRLRRWRLRPDPVATAATNRRSSNDDGQLLSHRRRSLLFRLLWWRFRWIDDTT